jgi:hypothetical protein
LDRCRRLKKKPIAFITRLLRLDAALYEPAAPRKPGQMGRPRLKGSRLPNLSVVADDPKTVWIPITVSSCYGEGERTVEVVSETALWYSTGFCPQCPCVGFDPRSRIEESETQALLCTDLDAEPERIISWFARRWQMEATFQEVRQRLGFETQRHWSELAVRRTAPVLLGLFSMVTLFANGYMAKKKNANAVVRGAAWYDKQRPTFSDALALVRKELFVGAGSDFLRVARANRYAKSPGGIGATTNRCGLLHGVNG